MINVTGLNIHKNKHTLIKNVTSTNHLVYFLKRKICSKKHYLVNENFFLNY